MIPWEWVIPTFLVSGAVGWFVGVIKGHGETQIALEKSERKIIDLLGRLHEADMSNLEMMDLLMGAVSDPAKSGFYMRRWQELREEIRQYEEGEETGFYGIKYRP